MVGSNSKPGGQENAGSEKKKSQSRRWDWKPEHMGARAGSGRKKVGGRRPFASEASGGGGGTAKIGNHLSTTGVGTKFRWLGERKRGKAAAWHGPKPE